MKKIAFLYLSILLISACHSKKVIVSPSEEVEIPTTKGISFTENKNTTLSQILEQAKAEKKLVFVDAYASWCAPCKLMDKEVFTNTATGVYFDQHFISYKLNVEKNNGPTVKLLYTIDVLPTLLFLNADGDVLARANNSITLSELNSLARKAVGK